MSWWSEARDTLKALTTKEEAPDLPAFPPIHPDNVQPASILLFYGHPGNSLTERIGANLYHYPNHPPFHAALMMRDGVFHNVGKFRTDKLLLDEFKSTRRIDVISYAMTDEQRSAIMRATELDTSVPHTGLEITDYGIGTFLNFGFPWINHSKKPICSEDVVRLLSAGGVVCADKSPEEVAPWDLMIYANSHASDCKIYTVWVGEDYNR